MAYSLNEQLARLEKQKEKAERKIRELRQQEKVQARKNENRRKVLIGAMMLEKVKQQKYSQADLLEEMNRFLTRDNERALFGLTPQGKNDEADSAVEFLSEFINSP